MIIKIYWTCWTVNVELDVGYKKNLIVVLLEIFSLSFCSFSLRMFELWLYGVFFFVFFVLFCLPFHDFYLSGCAQVWLKPRPLLSLVHSLCGTDNTIHSSVHRQNSRCGDGCKMFTFCLRRKILDWLVCVWVFNRVRRSFVDTEPVWLKQQVVN